MTAPTAYVITLLDLPQSVEAAQRTIASAAAVGITARMTPATPAAQAEETFRFRRWPTDKFRRNRYSRPLPAMGCFASHADLWALSVEMRQPIIICEHDCIFTAPFPSAIHDTAWCVNLGKPSYGKWRQPTCGISPMKHKDAPHYMGGAHCYLVRPQGAKEFLRLAASEAEPTDVFLQLARFAFLRDWFPWIAEARPTFSSVQRAEGCAAKHDRVSII